jgi:trans-aconitate 2-methyltransferase
METWNPDLYLKFEEERTQPARDLVARIQLHSPKRIVDLGCGPGNSTRVLRARWPEADILGMDSSAGMIEKARRSNPHGKWLQADIRAWNPGEMFDVVFSNATLQWIMDHDALIPRLFGWVRPGGALAVQLPSNQEAPLHKALIRVSRRDEWKARTDGCAGLIVYQSPEFYYGILSGLTPYVHLWKAVYYHVLENHQGLIDWYSSTGMKTYLERLPEESQKDAFRAQVLEECRDSYLLQRDGRILYPFERLFFIAYRR